MEPGGGKMSAQRRWRPNALSRTPGVGARRVVPKGFVRMLPRACLLAAALCCAGSAAHAAPLLHCDTTLPDAALLPGWQTAMDGNVIPATHWGSALRAMKPVRVFADRANIAVALEQRPESESGVCFVPRASSYLPQHHRDGRRFACSGKGERLRFVFAR